jgi:hypothetical protein
MPTVTTRTMGWMRTSVGVALLAAPGVPLQMAGTGVPTGAALLLMRTIGVRDLVLGLGTVASTGDVAEDGSALWLRATLASDVLDTVVGLLAVRSIGRRDAVVAAGLALAFVWGDLLALRAQAAPVSA